MAHLVKILRFAQDDMGAARLPARQDDMGERLSCGSYRDNSCPISHFSFFAFFSRSIFEKFCRSQENRGRSRKNAKKTIHFFLSEAEGLVSDFFISQISHLSLLRKTPGS